MSGIILCIDDEPIRYTALKKYLLTMGIHIIYSCRMEEVSEYLDAGYPIMGICLDHDMPFNSGVEFAKVICDYNYPVAITSSNPSGAQNISNVLNEYETPNLILPCIKNSWELEAMLFFGINHGF